jgi:hypothetical protein
LTSYASNAAVFGLDHGGAARFPSMFNARGTSNSVIFFERCASAGSGPERHLWYGMGSRENYLYPPAQGLFPSDPKGAPAEGEFTPPEFDVKPPEQANSRAPQAFSSSGINVLSADASVRTLSKDVSASTWAWACSITGPVAERPRPSDW